MSSFAPRLQLRTSSPLPSLSSLKKTLGQPYASMSLSSLTTHATVPFLHSNAHCQCQSHRMRESQDGNAKEHSPVHHSRKEKRHTHYFLPSTPRSISQPFLRSLQCMNEVSGQDVSDGASKGRCHTTSGFAKCVQCSTTVAFSEMFHPWKEVGMEH